MKKQIILILCLLVLCRAQAELRVPAFTAYLEPDPDGAAISSDSGISGWTNPALKVLWFGDITTTGQLNCSLELRLPAGVESKLRLTVEGQSHEVNIKGGTDNPVKADFGAFEISKTGNQQFTLESLNLVGQPAGELQTLVLDGSASAGAHFSLNPGRGKAAASVHLSYPVTRDTKIAAFYCEVTGLEDPTSTYYMACGWNRGYFGMQVNSPTERRIIFSVWDSGSEKMSRTKVGEADRVTLVVKGEGVYTGDFGNEGTGGHSHLVYDWKTGAKQRFLVTAKPTDATHTIYSGYWFQPEQKKWMLIASWKAPKEGGWLRGLYSFVEDFNGDNGQLRRKALYGDQWICTAEGKWIELTQASFSTDSTGKTGRFDRYMGVENGEFFLSTGGFIPGFTKYGTLFTRPATGHSPADVVTFIPKNNL